MIIKNKKGYVNIRFNEFDKNEIRNKTPYGKYLEDLKNFYTYMAKKIYHNDIEVDFATQKKVRKSISLKGREINFQTLSEIEEEVHKKLVRRKIEKNFEPKIDYNKCIEYIGFEEYMRINNIKIIKFCN